MRPRIYSCALVFFSFILSADAATVREGVLDLRSIPLKDNSVALNGFWRFYPNQLIHEFPPEKSYTVVPSWWDAAEKNPPVHYGTYRLWVLISKEDLHQTLALKMLDVYSSYTLWIDGNFAGSNGKVGTTKETSSPQWKPDIYSFIAEKDTLEIIIHFSNFYHSRSGINSPIYLGDNDKLVSEDRQTKVSGAILFFSLWIFAIIAMILYFIDRKKNRALIHFAALCIAWALRSIFSNYYLAVQWFPEISWNLCVRTEYISLYLSTLFGSLLVGRLFPREVNLVFTVIYVVCCGLFTVLTLVTQPIIFTQFVQLYVMLSATLLVSMLVIITKAYIEGRQGMNYLVVCVFLAVIMFAYVILSYQGLFELNALVFNAGFFLLFLASGISTVIRLNKMATTFDHDVMTLEQFNRLNKD